MSGALLSSDRAPGLLVAEGVEIPADAQIAPYVTVYGGVELGAGVSLEQGAIVGRPQQLDPRSHSERRPPGGVTRIGEGARVGSNSVVVAGARIGAGAYVGDLVLIRETAVVHEEALVGKGSTIGVHTRIGARTRIQASSLVGSWVVLEEDVHISPRVTFVGDPTMGRRKEGGWSEGTVVRRASRIGTSAIVLPPCEIGEEAVVGAASLVRGDVPPRTVVAGTPARRLREVRDDELLEHWG